MSQSVVRRKLEAVRLLIIEFPVMQDTTSLVHQITRIVEEAQPGAQSFHVVWSEWMALPLTVRKLHKPLSGDRTAETAVPKDKGNAE